MVSNQVITKRKNIQFRKIVNPFNCADVVILETQILQLQQAIQTFNLFKPVEA